MTNVFIGDFRVDKAFTFGALRLIPSMDIFNITNTNTILARRRTQYLAKRDDRSGLVVHDAAAEPDQRHPGAARHPVRGAGELVGEGDRRQKIGDRSL